MIQAPLLIAEACLMFKWKPEYCLKMPATRFFAMLRAGRKLEAMTRIEDCDIAAIPSCKSDYLKSVRSRFEDIVREETVPDLGQPSSNKVVLDAASPEARDYMFSIFAMKKGLST